MAPGKVKDTTPSAQALTSWCVTPTDAEMLRQAFYEISGTDQLNAVLQKIIVDTIFGKLAGMIPKKAYERAGALVARSLEATAQTDRWETLGKYSGALLTGFYISAEDDLESLDIFDGKYIDAKDKPGRLGKARWADMLPDQEFTEANKLTAIYFGGRDPHLVAIHKEATEKLAKDKGRDGIKLRNGDNNTI